MVILTGVKNNMITESSLRENIDNYTEEELSSMPNLSLDFIREFRDRIDLIKMYAILIITQAPPILSDKWYRWKERLQMFQTELLKESH